MTNERGFITHAVYFTYRSYDRIVLLYADSSATKASEKVQSMQSALKKGDTIATIGGLHGVVDSIDDKQVTLDCHGSLLTFDRQAVRTVLEVSEAPVDSFESNDNN